ncbi:hypothetical protein IFM89_036915 [Coptis chinensis]|uniref:Vesicle-fusing ATPase n=1 Tax=Coptis chinensis TaxID=261450 RepID=A0A835LTG8_9MAGN|nr:hypothetical protein IFM89_036915 [Coptis chinensis]
MTVGQKVPFEYLGTNFVFTVSQAAVEGQEKSNTLERGMISADIYIVFEASKASGIKIVNQREAASSHIFWHKEFNLESLGMLLYGPPGTGKTNGLADWENVRWKGTKGDQSELHVIIFDEIDAICKVGITVI